MRIHKVNGMPVFLVAWSEGKKSFAFGYDNLAKRFVYCYMKITCCVTFPAKYPLTEIAQ